MSLPSNSFVQMSLHVKLLTLVFVVLFIYTNLSIFVPLIRNFLWTISAFIGIGYFALASEASFTLWIAKQQSYIHSTNGILGLTTSSLTSQLSSMLFSWLPGNVSDLGGTAGSSSATDPSSPLPPPPPATVPLMPTTSLLSSAVLTPSEASQAVHECFHLEYTKAHFLVFLLYYIPQYKLYVFGFLGRWYWAHQYDILCRFIQNPDIRYLAETSYKATAEDNFTKAELKTALEEPETSVLDSIVYVFQKLYKMLIDIKRYLDTNGSSHIIKKSTKGSCTESGKNTSMSMSTEHGTKKWLEKAIKATDDVFEMAKTTAKEAYKTKKVYTLDDAQEKAMKYKAKQDYFQASKWYARAAKLGKTAKERMELQYTSLMSLLQVSDLYALPGCLLSRGVTNEMQMYSESYAVESSEFATVASIYKELGEMVVKVLRGHQHNIISRYKSTGGAGAAGIGSLVTKLKGGSSYNKDLGTNETSVAGGGKFEILTYTTLELDYFVSAGDFYTSAAEYYDKVTNYNMHEHYLTCAIKAMECYGHAMKYGQAQSLCEQALKNLAGRVVKGRSSSLSVDTLRLSELSLHLAILVLLQKANSIPSSFGNIEQYLLTEACEYGNEPIAFLNSLLKVWRIGEGGHYAELVKKLREYEEQYQVLYEYEISGLLTIWESMEYVDLK